MSRESLLSHRPRWIRQSVESLSRRSRLIRESVQPHLPSLAVDTRGIRDYSRIVRGRHTGRHSLIFHRSGWIRGSFETTLASSAVDAQVGTAASLIARDECADPSRLLSHRPWSIRGSVQSHLSSLAMNARALRDYSRIVRGRYAGRYSLISHRSRWIRGSFFETTLASPRVEAVSSYRPQCVHQSQESPVHLSTGVRISRCSRLTDRGDFACTILALSIRDFCKSGISKRHYFWHLKTFSISARGHRNAEYPHRFRFKAKARKRYASLEDPISRGASPLPWVKYPGAHDQFRKLILIEIG